MMVTNQWIEEIPVMTTLPAPTDALTESYRLITMIEQLRGELPFADDILALHRPTHHELEISAAKSEQAVAAWREALARRWESEVAGLRLYKRIVRQLAEHYGSEDAPEVQMLSRGGTKADSSPAELLTLRRDAFEGVAEVLHNYDRLRDLADTVPEETLRSTPAQVAAAYPAEWRRLLGR